MKKPENFASFRGRCERLLRDLGEPARLADVPFGDLDIEGTKGILAIHPRWALVRRLAGHFALVPRDLPDAAPLDGAEIRFLVARARAGDELAHRVLGARIGFAPRGACGNMFVTCRSLDVGISYPRVRRLYIQGRNVTRLIITDPRRFDPIGRVEVYSVEEADEAFRSGQDRRRGLAAWYAANLAHARTLVRAAKAGEPAQFGWVDGQYGGCIWWGADVSWDDSAVRVSARGAGFDPDALCLETVNFYSGRMSPEGVTAALAGSPASSRPGSASRSA
jgi:hypothetical protein